ncbi:MAG: hypothetical protein ABF820_13020 [Sporolactobacillus sp.]
MTDVVAASGLSRGGVYRYFPNTESMMQAFLERDLQEGNDYLEQLMHRSTMQEALSCYLYEVEKNLDPSSTIGIAIYEYFIGGYRKAERKAFLLHRYQRAQTALCALLAKGVHTGEFHPQLPIESITRFIINVCDGLYLESQLTSRVETGSNGQLGSLRLYLTAVLQLDRPLGSC